MEKVFLVEIFYQGKKIETIGVFKDERKARLIAENHNKNQDKRPTYATKSMALITGTVLEG